MASLTMQMTSEYAPVDVYALWRASSLSQLRPHSSSPVALINRVCFQEMHAPSVEVEIEAMPHLQDLPLPSDASAGASGVDLRAANTDTIVLRPGKHALVPTGIRVRFPPGTEGQVRGRSGLALRHSVTVLNAPGTIDSDYRGEVLCLLEAFPLRLLDWSYADQSRIRAFRGCYSSLLLAHLRTALCFSLT
jgi:dUTPase